MESQAALELEDYYGDRDGSYIKAIHQENSTGSIMLDLMPPTENMLVAAEEFNAINCVYFFSSRSLNKSKQISALTSELNKLIEEEQDRNKLLIFGFDSVGDQDDLIQIGGRKRILLIHKSSGLHNSKPLQSFFANNSLTSNRKRLFVGAELARTALGTPLHGCFDLTPLFSNWLERHPRVKPEMDLPKPFAGMLNTSHKTEPLPLKSMVEKALSVHWMKDRAISSSSWSTQKLTLPQLKYAALEVWAAVELGHLAVRTFAPLGLFRRIFSTHPNRLNSDLRLSLKNYVDQSCQLSDVKRDWQSVKVANMTVASRSQNKPWLEVKSGEYANHLRMGGEVRIVIQSPGGYPHGVTVHANVTNVQGKLSDVNLYSFSIDKELHKYSHPVDRQVVHEVARDGVKAIKQYWCQWFDANGEYRRAPSAETNRHRGRKRSVKIMTLDSGCFLLRQVNNTVSDLVRGHTMTREDAIPPTLHHLPSNDSTPTTAEIVENYDLETLMALLRKERFPNKLPDLSEEEEQNIDLSIFAEQLNQRQFQGLRNALSHKISAIKGPPGTGKTRTIAAMADVCCQAKKRMLIIAPANTASRRILESVVGAGFQDVCLVVSEEYFFEWHESSYVDSLRELVHTKKRSHEEHDNRMQTRHPRVTAAERADQDFQERKVIGHVGKWTEVAVRGASEERPPPSVLIGTYGCIASALFSGGKSSWGNEVLNLLQVENIDFLVVDETSQLWDGYSFGMLCRLSNLKNMVLVGDEKQLAPYGENRVENMQSLFSAAISHPDVPCVQLNESFRLSPEVGSVISRNVYEGDLLVRRLAEVDQMFITRLQSIYEACARTSPQRTLSANVKALLNLLARRLNERSTALSDSVASLTWIQNASPSYTNPTSKSSGNLEEAKLLAQLVTPLIVLIDREQDALGTLGSGEVKGASRFHRLRIVILTPYLEQKKILESELAKSLENFRGRDYAETVEWISSSLFVNTVDSFQGQEAEFVFLSMVRSRNDSPGFLKDQRRANVMLSRSSQMMVIVGDSQHSLKKRKSGKEQGLVGEMAKAVYLHGTLFSIDGESGELIPNDLVVESSAEIKTLSDSSVKKKWQKNTKSAVNKNTINNPTTVVGLENQKLGPLR